MAFKISIEDVPALTQELVRHNLLIENNNVSSILSMFADERKNSVVYPVFCAFCSLHYGEFRTGVEFIEEIDSMCESVDTREISISRNGYSLRLNAPVYYMLKGHILGSIVERHDDSLEAFELYNLHQVDVHPEIVKKNRVLYSFRRFNDYSLEDLTNNTITVVSPLEMNDPFDTLMYPWIEARYKSAERIAIELGGGDRAKDVLRSAMVLKESMNYYRIRSFVKENKDGLKPYHNTLMWSHYADSHKGFCIKYSLSKDMQAFQNSEEYRLIRSVKYSSEAIDLDSQREIDGLDALFLKSSDWGYENEVRLLTYITKTDSPFLSIPLDHESKIEEIYFGIKTDRKTIDSIMSSLQDRDIKYYQMKQNFKDIYKLDLEEIEI